LRSGTFRSASFADTRSQTPVRRRHTAGDTPQATHRRRHTAERRAKPHPPRSGSLTRAVLL